MKKNRILLSVLLIACLAITFMAGCTSKKKDDSSSNSNSDSSNTAFSNSDGIDENGYWKDIKALDYVELFDYKKLSIPTETSTVTDATLKTTLDKYLEDNPIKTEIKDRAIADKDTVNIDYVGSVDGVEFKGGSTEGKGTEVIIGTTSYIDDFIEQLIGHKPGETFDVNVTFPDKYSTEELSNKDAVFKTTINFIVDKKTPELTDSFVKEVLSEKNGWNTVDEMKKALTANLKQSQIQTYIGNYMKKDVKISSVPESMIDYQNKSMIKYYEGMAEQYQMEFDVFIEGFAKAKSKEELIANSVQEVTDTARYYLVIQAIAEKENISVSEDNLKAYFKAATGSEDYSAHQTTHGLPYLKNMVISSFVLDMIYENCVL